MLKYRISDLVISILILIISMPILFAVSIINHFCSNGSPFFLQKRVGKNKKPFTLIKFRTMKIGTHSIATHLAESSSITAFGKILRKSKLDELPQLINVVKGDMSLVGPRPNLFNQKELINERTSYQVYDVLPGLTGLSQINNIDMSSPKRLSRSDAYMIQNMSLKNYYRYIILTAIGKGYGDAIK